MMTIDQMRERKRAMGYSYETIAQRAGLPLSTVQKVLGGYSKSPREKTLRLLEEALTPQPALYDTDMRPLHASDGLAESALNYDVSAWRDRDRLWTVEECLQLPEDSRIELFDGVIYDLAAPVRIHQTLLVELLWAIRSHIDSCDRPCKVYPAPFFVRLDNDNKTFVEPDISVICDPSKLSDDGCEGAPDWIVEIISPSTKHRDFGIKLFRYRSAGVKLYWIVDPEEQKVWVYDFEHGDDVQICSFSDRVKVSLCEDFEIDFSGFDLR